MVRSRWVIIAAILVGVGRAKLALGRGDAMEVGSSAVGSGPLRLGAFAFSDKVVTTPQSV
jgi:hypothetical protein